LYDKATGISDLMTQRIKEYGESIGIHQNEVADVTLSYYKKYGLAIRGLIKYHHIDPLDFDRKVDQSLSLEAILKPNLKLRKMLLNLNIKKWAFTNANYPHAKRVLRLLGIDDLFAGITYCDYSSPNFYCKPEHQAYLKAMAEAHVHSPLNCYFIDDSIANLNAAKQLGWSTVLVSNPLPKTTVNHLVIQKVSDLPLIMPELFKLSLK